MTCSSSATVHAKVAAARSGPARSSSPPPSIGLGRRPGPVGPAPLVSRRTQPPWSPSSKWGRPTISRRRTLVVGLLLVAAYLLPDALPAIDELLYGMGAAAAYRVRPRCDRCGRFCSVKEVFPVLLTAVQPSLCERCHRVWQRTRNIDKFS